MSRSLTGQLFVPSHRRSEQVVSTLLEGLRLAGFRFDRESGGGGCIWIDTGGGLELRTPIGWEDAKAAYAPGLTWVVQLTKRLMDEEGGIVDVTLSFPSPRQSSIETVATVQLSLGAWPKTGRSDGTFEEFVAWIQFLCGFLDPFYGWAGSSLGLFGCETEEVQPERIENVQPQPLEWLNIFGPSYVQRIGLRRLRSTPAWRVGFLASGGVSVLLGPDPDTVSKLEAVTVGEHLGVPVQMPS